MFEKILHASDGSEHSFHALTLALAIAQQNKSELHMVCVQEIPYMPQFIEEVREAAGPAAQRIRELFARARAAAGDYRVILHTHAIAGHPVRDVIRLTASLKADLLVIGARGHSALYERMMGSHADRMVQLAPCPVLAVKLMAAKGRGPTFEKILSANDGSKHATRALALALAIAKQNKAEMHMACIEELPYLSDMGEAEHEDERAVGRRIEGVLHRGRTMAQERGVEICTHVIKGHPVREIVRLAAGLDVGLLAIGAKGHSALYERMVGSQADRMMQLANCPVLVAK